MILSMPAIAAAGFNADTGAPTDTGGSVEDNVATAEADGGVLTESLAEQDVGEPTTERASARTASNTSVDGSSTNLVVISSVEDLQAMNDDRTADYVLRNDIDASETADWNDGAGFEPVGDSSDPFFGTFDGQGHVIENLTIDRPDESFVGLFGRAAGSGVTIENVQLEGMDVRGQDHTGGLIGELDDGTVLNSSVEGHVEAQNQRVGGMVGRGSDATLDQRLTARGTVEGGDASGTDRGTGGLLGRASHQTEVSVVYAQSNVSGPNAGGVIGSSSTNPSTFEEIYGAGSVDADDAGAIVGLIESSGDVFEPSVYWNEERTADEYGIDESSGSATNDMTPLRTDEMQGSNAAENMSGFDFEDTWVTLSDPDDYPVFFWEETAPGAPEAEIDRSTGTPDVGESIELDANQSGGEIDDYEWEFGDGTTATGESVSHTYDEPGEYTIELTVIGPNGRGTATSDIFASAEDEFGFSVVTTDPTANLPVRFEASADGEHEWTFGDGEQATGTSGTIEHIYEEGGEYEVTMTADGESLTRTISVDEPELTVETTDGIYGGELLELFDIEYTHQTEVDSELSVESVTVDVDGETYNATDTGVGIWKTADFDPTDLEEDTTLTVTATDELGNQETEEIQLTAIDVPEWMVWLLDNAEETTRDAFDPRLDQGGIDVTLFDREQGIDVLSGVLPWDRDFDAAKELEFQTRLTHDWELQLGLDGDGEVVVKGIGIDVTGGGSGTVDSNRNLVSANVNLAGAVSRTVWSHSFDPPIVPSQTIEAKAEAGAEASAEFSGDGGTPSFDRGEFGPNAELSGELSTGVDGAELKATLSGSAGGVAGFGFGSPFLKDVTIPVESAVSGEVSALFLSGSIDVTIVDEEITLIDTQGQARTIDDPIATGDVEWELQDKRGSRPLSAVQSADDSSTVPAATDEPSDEVVHERLSDRSYEDTRPAIGSTTDGLAVAWSAQQANRSVEEGRDIAIRTADDDWTDRTWLTDDDRHDSDVDLARLGDDSELLATWTRVDANASEMEPSSPDELYPYHEIAISTANASEPTAWSDVTLLSELVTETTVLTTQPAVVAGDDRWLVAWERHGTNDLAAFDDRAVEYALLEPTDDGVDIVANGTVADAARPDVSVRSDGDFDLAYYEPDDGTDSGSVVQGVIESAVTPSGSDRYVEHDRHAVTGFGHHAVADGRLVWSAGVRTDERLYDATDGTVETLPLDGNISSLDEIELLADGDRTVLSYRGSPADRLSQDIVYRMEHDGEWVADRRLADTGDDLVGWHTDSLLADDGEELAVAYAVTETDTDAMNDVFVATDPFPPTHTVAADVEPATAGNSTTVNYTVRNVGGDAATEETIVLSNGTDIVDSATVGPLETNERVDGQFEATVDETGTFDVELASVTGQSSTAASTTPLESDSEPWHPTSVTTTAGEPSVGIEDADVRFEDGSSVATVTLFNRGDAAATEIPVAIGDGETVAATETVDRLGVTETTTVEFDVDFDSISQTEPALVELDPDRSAAFAADHRHDERAFLSTWLFQPDLTVHDPADYDRSGDEPTVTVPISNDGTMDVETTVSVHAGDEEVGSTTIDIGADANATVFEDAIVDFEQSIEANESITVFADTAEPDADPSTMARSDTVRDEIVVPDDSSTGSVDIRTVLDKAELDQTEILVGENVTITAAASTTGPASRTEAFELIVDDDVVSDTDVAVPTYGSAAVEFTHVFNETGEFDVQIDDTVVDTVTVTDDHEGSGDRNRADEADDSDPRADDGDDTGDDGVPGFGVIAVVVAIGVVLSVLVATERRRTR